MTKTNQKDDHPTPELAAVGEPVRIGDDAPYCAFTDVAQTPSGELLVVYSAGENHLDAGLCIEMRRSADQGRTWSEPTVIVDPIHSGHGVRDPHLARLRDGRLVLSYFEYPVKGDPTWSSVRSWVRVSDDDGCTWSEPTALAADRLPGAVTCNHAIELADGRLLISIFGGDIEDEDGEILGVVASRDRGATWGDFVELHREPARQGMECELAEIADGQLVALVRRTSKKLGLRLESADVGRTWSAPEAVPIGHAPGILVDGGIMLINHRTFPDGRARENTSGEARGNYAGKCTVVSLSLDAGRSFVAHLPLGQPVRNDFGGDTAYGGIVKLPNGDYFTTYYTTTVPGGTAVFGQRLALHVPHPNLFSTKR